LSLALPIFACRPLLPCGKTIGEVRVSEIDSAGLETVLLANRERLLGFLRAHGAGHAAEDLLQELWLRVRDSRSGPIGQPLSYLYRIANNLMLDRYRSERQATIRERDWTDVTGVTVPGRSDEPAGERVLIARETLDGVQSALAALGPRVERVFRRHRLDGVPQRVLAAELGVSLSTIESDLRKAVQALVELRKTIDEN
jgi:RNA polymerase sigma-70 factor (ECF subfamily)